MRFDRDDFGPVEDRGRGGGFGFGGGGFGGGGGMLGMVLPFILGRFGMGGILILLVILFFSGALGSLGGLFGGGGQQAVGPTAVGRSGVVEGAEACRTDETKRFVCNAHGSTVRVFNELFAEQGQRFRPATLVFYQQGTSTACGQGQSAMGPFYCPADQRIYIDTSFFAELARMAGDRGDFAQAYVVAHEMGHHIQTITGTSDRIRRAQQGASERESNALQVRMELQADCLAGVWGANVARSGDQLDPGDLEEGLRAANAIGDDTLQRSAGRAVVPESFTHGTSAQRQQALRRGFESGRIEACATYTQGI